MTWGRGESDRGCRVCDRAFTFLARVTRPRVFYPFHRCLFIQTSNPSSVHSSRKDIWGDLTSFRTSNGNSCASDQYSDLLVQSLQLQLGLSPHTRCPLRLAVARERVSCNIWTPDLYPARSSLDVFHLVSDSPSLTIFSCRQFPRFCMVLPTYGTR
jgi:hypothetical protein